LPHFGDKLLRDIAPALVEGNKQKRLAEPSRRISRRARANAEAILQEDAAKALSGPGISKYLTKPATVNREVACLKAIFNKAIANDKAERSPFHGKKGKMLKENNERDRLLTPEEYFRLLAHCGPQIKPIVKVAYYTGIRQGEILFLTWGQVDLKEGFIHLRPEDTKTHEARSVPLSQELIEIFQAMHRGLPGVRVFPYKGKAFGRPFKKLWRRREKGLALRTSPFTT
jgi:integrase